MGYSRLTDDAHARKAECSNVGTCDRTTGACKCQPGFEGVACERMSCPGIPTCGGSGRCISLRQAGAGYDGFRLKQLPVSYSNWDADRIFGCLCDPGTSGPDCASHSCPLGDDPTTSGAAEIQTVACTCLGGCASGSITVSFAGRTARILTSAVVTKAEESPYSARNSGSAPGESLESALLSLRDIDTITSVAAQDGVGSTICGPGQNWINVTFRKSVGNVPDLVFAPGTSQDVTGGAAILQYWTPVQATTESIPCSGQGICNANDGSCACFPGFWSSDGDGNSGTIPDCGSLTSPNGTVSVVTTCPVSNCNNNGICALNSHGFPVCSCYSGWSGPTCSDRPCPIGRAWFDEPSASNVAHGYVECSNAGVCQRSTGRCVCRSGFTGSACDRLSCPSDDPALQCSGHGVCLSMRELARVGSFGGDQLGSFEVQQVKCQLVSGAWTLSMAGTKTIQLGVDAKVSDLVTQLQLLPGVGILSVRTSPPGMTYMCQGGSDDAVMLTFTSQLGDVPLLVPDFDSRYGNVSVSELVKGSRTTYGNDESNPSTWDADMIFGCHCDGTPDWNQTDQLVGDKSIWYGPICNMRSCAVASDPLLYLPDGYTRLVTEQQNLFCQTGVAGSFRVGFRGRTSGDISSSASVADLKIALQSIESIGIVDVAIQTAAATSICSADGVNTLVTFNTELGDLPRE